MIIKGEAKRKRQKKIEQNTQELWDNYKSCNIHIIETPDEEEKKKLKQ